MIQSKQKVKDLCEKLMQVNPHQILIDLVQDDVEELLNDKNVTPDDIIALSYGCDLLLEVYDIGFDSDYAYLCDIKDALDSWGSDAEFANKSLGLDPNQ
jgi:hypothetical protein